MPVFSSGQTAAQIGDTYAAIGHLDLIYACGGGIMGHPDGISAGVQSLQLAWEAAAQGIEIEQYARSHAVLAKALTTFGGQA
jgi:ribulose-bisphosphate carboxylase large chain